MNICESTIITTQQTFKPYHECFPLELMEGDICRICLFNTVEESNPILSLCKCKGSVNVLHLKCLKLWLEQKLTKKEIQKPGISYTIKSFNCEICKEPYPTTIKYNDVLYHLMNYFVPEGQNFIILESLNSIKENQYPLSIHVLMFVDEGDSFILGRGHESDIRISDISVSRSHAKIYFKDKKFMLEDTGSKFGTLVLAKDAVQVGGQASGPTILQIGRTLIHVAEIDDKWCLMNKNNHKEEKITNFLDNDVELDNMNLMLDSDILTKKEGNLLQENINFNGEDKFDSDEKKEDSDKDL